MNKVKCLKKLNHNFKQENYEDFIIARTGWSGELSYELYLQDRKLGNKLFELVYAAAEESSPSTLQIRFLK